MTIEAFDPTPRLDVSEVIAGVEFPDPYRWLEDETPASQAWERLRHDAAGEALAALPGFDEFVKVVEARATRCLVLPPRRAGKNWFALAFEGGKAVIVASDDPRGQENRRVITSADDLLSGPAAGLDWFFPSPDGTKLAVGVSRGGDEQSILNVLAVDSGARICPPIPYVHGGRLAWTPDGTQLYIAAGIARDTEDSVKRLFVLDVDRGEVARVPGFETSERSLVPHISTCGRYLGVATNFISPRLLHLLDRETGEWTNLPDVGERDETFFGVFVEDRYFAVTTVGANRGRLVTATLDALGDPSRWQELVPEGEGTMRSVSIATSGLLISDYVGGLTRLRLVSHAGEVLDTIPLPDRGAVYLGGLLGAQLGGDPPVHVTDDDVTFIFSNVATTPASYRYDLATRELEELEGSRGPGLENARVVELTATSKDGREVPYVLIAPPAEEVSEPLPTAILGYGGWNIMTLAQGYPGVASLIVEAGGAIVIPHLRGDSTYGYEQWKDGKLANKQKSFDDLFAVADDLLANGVTTKDQLALCGSSNGGLLGGAVVTQRPDLFTAIVCAVPLLDMNRFVIEHFSELFTEEYGDPRQPEDARYLRAYSPPHNVTENTEYPAFLLVAGRNDVRCQPWHARKMQAALEHAQAGDAPLLLRVHEDTGHATAAMLGSPTLMAEWLGFLMHYMGLKLTLPTKTPAGQIGSDR